MSGGKSTARREVPCPACGQPALFAPENPARPFCSERCRQHDLGAWASENYRIGPAAAPDADGPDIAPPTEH